MLNIWKVPAGRLWKGALLVVLIAWGALVGVATQVSSTVGQDVAAIGDATELPFDNPESIAKRFDAELRRLTSDSAVPSPKQLALQIAENQTCSIAIQPDAGQKLDAPAIYARARAGSVIVGAVPKGKNRHRLPAVFASGFVIHRDGVIVSNAHVLEAFEDMKAIGAMTSDGRVFPIKAVLAADRIHDVAILKVEAADLTPLPLATSVAVGATVYCLSHPLMNNMGTENGFFAFTQGIVSGRYRSRLLGETPINVLTITADYAQGSSGGPILNEHGAVVGIVCETLTISDDADSSQMTWKFVRPSSTIRALLQGKRSGK